jgi:hypothetical protein
MIYKRLGGEKEKNMKNGLSIILVAFVILSVLGTMGIATAVEESPLNIEVGSTLSIVGNGTMSRSMLAQSGYGFEGQRLVEEMFSGYRGTMGPSTVDYKSSLNMYAGLSDTLENESSIEIEYASTVFTSLMKREVCAKNYKVGAVSAIKTSGDSGTAMEISMTPEANYLAFEGTVDGKTRLSQMVVDPGTHLKAVKEITNLDGKFTLDYEAFAEKLIDVGDEGDWLGCP